MDASYDPPSITDAVKRCRLCSTVVSGKRRLRDSGGFYYCLPCAAQLRAAKRINVPSIDGVKRCHVCRLEVADQPRFKDAAGHYYCAPCGKEIFDIKPVAADLTMLAEPIVLRRTSGPTKHCCVCDVDLANQPRVKDESGHYFCESCGSKLRYTYRKIDSQLESGTIVGSDLTHH